MFSETVVIFYDKTVTIMVRHKKYKTLFFNLVFRIMITFGKYAVLREQLPQKRDKECSCIMEIRVLPTQTAQSLPGLDPLGIMDRAALTGYRSIGIFEGEAGQEEPLGLLLYSEQFGSITMEWLYVHEEHRGKGCGEALLAGLFKIADHYRYRRVYAALPELLGRSRFCPYEYAYLSDRYFDEVRTLPPEWHGSLAAIARRPAFWKMLGSLKQSEKDKGHTLMPLSKLTFRERNQLLDKMDTTPHAVRLYPLKGRVRDIDSDISICCVKDRTILGVALGQTAGKSVYLSGLFARSVNSAKGLLAAFLDLSEQKYPDYKVHIIFRDNIFVKPMAELLGQFGQGRLLAADTLVYPADQDISYEIPSFMEALFPQGVSDEAGEEEKPRIAAGDEDTLITENEDEDTVNEDNAAE